LQGVQSLRTLGGVVLVVVEGICGQVEAEVEVVSVPADAVEGEAELCGEKRVGLGGGVEEGLAGVDGDACVAFNLA